MHRSRLLLLASLAILASTLAFPQAAHAQGGADACCVVLDNGGGTADHVPGCPAGYVGQMQMVSGLPLGSTLQLASTLETFAGLTQVPGGTLGGNKENWTAVLPIQFTGTGVFSSYVHSLTLPISAGESHSAPRTPFNPVQSFNTLLFTIQGQTVTDPDFDLLRITAGNGFGLPSPGHTIFTQVAGAWAVDSYFDITYRVDFIGSATGPFAGLSGSTTNTYRFTMCHTDATPVRQSTWGAVKAVYR